MTTAIDTRRLLLVCAGVAFLMASLYGLMGFFQAVMLFTGERALKNSNIWSSVFLVAVALATMCFASSRHKRSSRAPYLAVARVVLLGVCLFLSAAAAWRVASDYVALDSCLDLGGSFDYVRSVCDLTDSHAVVSLFAWRGFFLTSTFVFAVPVVIAVARQRKAKERPNAP
ncbi:MAG: hypothetical protein C0428_02915 [Polaromonas sp.]|nr:hypothetical protein [Polaromonas sp.]